MDQQQIERLRALWKRVEESRKASAPAPSGRPPRPKPGRNTRFIPRCE